MKCHDIAPAEATNILSSGGRWLIDRYWGSYVAFLRGRESHKTWIVRSPAGHLPCLSATFQHLHIFFSSMEDFAQLAVLSLSINWDYVAVYAACGRVQCRETGINEVEELQLGECKEIRANGETRRFYWNPADIAREAALEDVLQARTALRETTRMCVDAWASCHDQIIQRLSGGIDSSILTGCLRSSARNPKVACVNFYTKGAFGDERQYARIVAAAAEFDLIEVRRNSRLPLATLMNMERAASPFAYILRLGWEDVETRLAKERKASAVFAGTLGDILFQMPPATPVATEYLQRYGFSSEFLRVAMNAAQMDRVSLWSVIRAAFANGLRHPPTHWLPGEFQAREVMLLTPEAAEAFAREPLRFVHPWLHSVDGVPFGKLVQVSCLAFNSSYCDVLQSLDDPVLVHPFISEPMVEVCLRIPSHLMVRDGWDRALAREAFAQELPDEIRKRTSKGSMDLWARELVAHNATFIREALLDGILVKERLVDRQKLEQCMPGVPTKNPLPIGCFLDYVCAEAWLRVWTENKCRAAA
ncbi:MAG: asparagine synthase-related protein [Steroidobacter sp.]